MLACRPTTAHINIYAIAIKQKVFMQKAALLTF